MADINKTVGIIFEGQDNTVGAIGGLDARLKGIEQSSGGAGKGLKDVGTELDSLGKKSDGLDKLDAMLKSLAATLVVKAFIDANVEAERFMLTMKATTGSTSEAAKEFDYVRDVADRLGLELGSAAGAYSDFSAAVKGSSINGTEARIIFEAFAGTMATLGKSSADISGALVQLSQGISKGKFELEDLKSVAERMPGFFEAFAASLGKPTSELFNLISAGKIGGEEILKFAQSIKQSGEPVDTYTANLNRLKNAISEAFLQIGNAGAFEVLKTAIQAGTASVVGAQAAMVLFGETLGNIAYTIKSGDWSGFGARLDESLSKAAASTTRARDALLGTEGAAKQLGTTAQSVGEQMGTSMRFSAEASYKAWKEAYDQIDKSLKKLGIDPKIFVDQIGEISDAFTSLATNAAATGEQIVVGLTGALQKLPQNASLDEFRRQIAYAFRDGKLSAEEYAQALALIDTKQKNLSPSFGPVSEAARKQAEEMAKSAKETDKAREAVEKMALEYEKIASNERLKTIELKMQFNTVNVQETTKRIQAAFGSINTTITSTGNLLANLFEMFGNYDNMNWSAIAATRNQMDIENKRRDEGLSLQKKLTEAQIENMKAQSAALSRDLPLIKIQGDGLKPHLESFMWEILKAIQVRVNKDGLKLLLGTG